MPKLEIKGTLLCSVTSENLAVGISSLEVVPFLLVLSLPQEHAEMVQLLMLEIHSSMLSNGHNRVSLISAVDTLKYAYLHLSIFF
jgi:hypothetical protein